jgi:FPC/CPF motif-containing protein YcgG
MPKQLSLKLKLDASGLEETVKKYIPQIKQLLAKHPFEFVMNSFFSCFHCESSDLRPEEKSTRVSACNFVMVFRAGGLFESIAATTGETKL